MDFNRRSFLKSGLALSRVEAPPKRQGENVI